MAETGFDFVGKLFGHEAAGHRDLEQKLTRLLGEDNLVGSCGEFGLLFAFLANKPGGVRIAGEPAVEVRDLKSMFVDKRLPEGWKTWKKNRVDWVTNTTGLLISAARNTRNWLQSVEYALTRLLPHAQ